MKILLLSLMAFVAASNSSFSMNKASKEFGNMMKKKNVFFSKELMKKKFYATSEKDSFHETLKIRTEVRNKNGDLFLGFRLNITGADFTISKKGIGLNNETFLKLTPNDVINTEKDSLKKLEISFYTDQTGLSQSFVDPVIFTLIEEDATQPSKEKGHNDENMTICQQGPNGAVGC